jgi:glutamate-ammonia-ligase adenylyltransferase
MIFKPFAEAVKNIPDVLHTEADEVVECLLQQHIADAPLADENQLNLLKYVLACSHFIQKQSKCHDDVVLKALERGIEQCEFSVESLHLELAPLLVEDINEDTVMVQLRRLRNREMMLIAWRDLVGASIEDVLCSLSELADEFIRFAVNWSYQTCCKRWGVPRDDLGEEQKLIVIGMGKLGAKELNFSSDIDLIFCYPSAGETDGSRSISNEEFFMRQCRQVVKLLDQQTVDGFVFRVDARLRPFGDSGALALNFDAMENYYQSHAREWERYAMVKARAITGIEEDKNYLMSMLRSFVFRRYLDYGVFDSIRVMKRQIEEQLKKKGVAHNVKLGPGGIREIEFIGQAFQLIRGGRDKPLQVRSIVEVLRLLAEKNHIPAQASEDLIEDYAYLRRLENRIQEIDDKQTHDLPKDEVSQARLVLSMQLNDWDSLLNRTQQTMQRVHKYFDTLVDFVPATPDAEVLDWLSLDSAVLEQFLNSKGVIASDQVQRDIIDFCNSYPVRQLQEKGRHYLSQLMPVLINAFLIEQSHEVTLSAFLNMLQAICNRVVYLVLLVENTSVLKHLIQLAILSPWVITQVTRSPILLDELIDPESLFNTATKEQLADELNSSLISVSADDVEGQMEALRHFKQVNVLRVAASDLTGVIPVMIVSDKLTEIAEVIVDKALTLSWRSVCETYGVPVGAKNDVVSGFAVIGFGKMGGIELGFGSDLDVVFIHKDADMNQLTVGGRSVSLAEFYMRLGRKMIAMMTTKTFSGPLYEMDLRLRPNGQSGLLVTSEVAFETYQKEQAWTWEHQALVRARYVAGCEQMKLSFERIRRDVLSESKDANTLKADIIQMREKMRDALLKHKEGCFDLKHGVGGIVDIEFIVQFAVLANACRYESLLMVTDNVRLLLDLCRIGVLTQAQQEGLTEAYKAYREASHHASLAELPTVLEAKSFEQHIKNVESVWQEVILN